METRTDWASNGPVKQTMNRLGQQEESDTTNNVKSLDGKGKETGSDQPAIGKVKSHEEKEEDYRYGGYHPVFIGEEFNKKRYVVERKLGWGHFSTVWLAYDRVAKRRVALKVVRSAEHYRETSIDEIRILQKICEGDDKHLGKNHVIALLDYFLHRGPNGAHVCMVFEVLGENLLSLIQSYGHRGVPRGIVQQISYQLLIALDYLHRKCGIIHTDLKPENVLICIEDSVLNDLDSQASLPSVSNSQNTTSTASTDGHASGTHGTPQKKSNQSSAGQVIASDPFTSTLTQFPSLEGAVSEISLRDSSLNRSNSKNKPSIRVKIADLGNACWTRKHFTNDIQTRQYRSPEVILGCQWGASADCWSFACIIFELLTGDYLFDPRSGSSYSKEDDHIAQIIELLMTFPKQMALSGKHSRELFNRRGELRNIHRLKYWPLKDVLEQKYHFSSSFSQEISDFLLPLLSFDPVKRVNAGYMSNSPWLHNVADPNFKIEDPGQYGEYIPGWANEIRK
ncbi:CMGC/SRPK protein kinase Dsk1 [Schizosaccharomyces cryophilus OY26]|uniref:non-specific serine/threonine protein kinase n=1 Tax=Schizosaccharomyces cryophilus (strain OY26 / ATCC MYA-4695 / CBS 11777 / NBRC 106824 / NRRL Y48691) TaxID=653667 RepID=S9VNG8_SCHCR|nr:CMGC/SRPK protein kinase Dsk1 [Schizosaccharomyces cryophilus OY26]EPY49498.1 CMGC/SRPK protein kinase Dsk1 [Schizosaccharomyces cryophilus OY26]